MTRSCWLLLGSLWLWPALVAAQEAAPADVPAESGGQAAPADDQPETVRLVLHPQGEPSRALAHLLLPPLVERRPGNAAPLYMKAMMRLNGVDRKSLTEMENKIHDWSKVPLDQLPLDEMRSTLARVQGVLDDADLAARREHCDWELPIRDRPFVTLLLPEVQETRRIARYLAASARLQIAERKYAEAERTLRTGFALARHVAEGPTLINALVGVAISRIMMDQMLDLLQQPDAPNYYWALTTLPSPLIDHRKALDAEGAMLYLSYPELRNVEQPGGTAEQWQALIRRILRDIGAEGGQPGNAEPAVSMGLAVRAMQDYPQAKKALIDCGRSRDEVEAMPVAQVILIQALDEYDRIRDESFKWSYVPFPAARQGMQAAERKLKELPSGRTVPLAEMLLPALQASQLAVARCDRQIGAMRIVEALRLYAAAYGKLPDRLSDLKVPAPLDPVTGESYVYTLSGGRATLSAPAPPGMQARPHALRFEITLAK